MTGEPATPGGGAGDHGRDAAAAEARRGAPADLAAALVALLTRRGLTVAVAESLTGGGVLDALVAVPGASRCVRGGVVAYATDLKSALLGVDEELLARQGAVHPEVATQMAAGVSRRLVADVGLATTGVAGPDPQDDRPPGTFHVAVRGPGGALVVHSVDPGPASSVPDRAAVRRAAREAVLRLALDTLADGG